MTEEKINEFKPLSSGELLKTLGLTIKQDEINKLVTFLCELSAYTDNSQFNISYNAPSSSGKSYIPTEIARLFPEEDIKEVGYCSPTAFFHDTGVFDKEKGTYTVDLSHKILIFLDQPHTLLLQHLRPLLSHDRKEIQIKITDKKQKFGLKTKNVILKGYPAVIFCTAGLKIDEQEATRFLLLSPEVNQEKIREGVNQIIKKDSDSVVFQAWLDADPERKLLKDRILAIKEASIQDVKITQDLQDEISRRFLDRIKILKPRHQRDIKRLMSLIKLFAVLNLWWRQREGDTVWATHEDIEEAFDLWGKISESQELNLPPYIYNLYKEVIVPAWHKNNSAPQGEISKMILGEEKQQNGISRQDIAAKHFEVYGRYLPDWQLRQQIIPMLESAGLIIQEADPKDKRKILIYPTELLTVLPKENYSELDGRVADEVQMLIDIEDIETSK